MDIEETIKLMNDTTDQFSYQFDSHTYLKVVKHLTSKVKRLEIDNALLKGTWHKHFDDETFLTESR